MVRDNCDYADEYTVVLHQRRNGEKREFSKQFPNVRAARQHAAIYSMYFLRACFMTGFPHVVFTRSIEGFRAWADAQDWTEDTVFRVEAYMSPERVSGHLIWFAQSNDAMLTKTIWGENVEID